MTDTNNKIEELPFNLVCFSYLHLSMKYYNPSRTSTGLCEHAVYQTDTVNYFFMLYTTRFFNINHKVLDIDEHCKYLYFSEEIRNPLKIGLASPPLAKKYLSTDTSHLYANY